MSHFWWWVGFNAVVLSLLALDLGVFHRRAHAVAVREAAMWSGFWVTLSLSFGTAVYLELGRQSGIEFFTGYLIEYALSVDNIFVFVLIFSYFRIPAEYQHRVLFWGILGALIFRGTMIALGAALIERFDWVLYIFGAFLIYTGVKMARQDRRETYDPEANPVLRLVRRTFPVTHRYHGQSFFVREQWNRHERWVGTPLLVVLVLVETTDVVFATDSIPAIFAITRDPLIVYTSNVCAVLGLRALYFLLAGIVDRFHRLQLGLSVVLVFIGVKMMLEDVAHVPTAVSLGVVAVVLAAAVFASLKWPRKEPVAVPPLAALASRKYHEHHPESPPPESDNPGDAPADDFSGRS